MQDNNKETMSAESDAINSGPGKVSRVLNALNRPKYRLTATVVMVLLISSAVSIFTTEILQPNTVVFDMKGTIDTFRQQTAQSSFDKVALDAMTKRFGDALETSLTQWQEKHHAVILVKGAVVSGMPDITPEIQADIADKMQGGQ